MELTVGTPTRGVEPRGVPATGSPARVLRERPEAVPPGGRVTVGSTRDGTPTPATEPVMPLALPVTVLTVALAGPANTTPVRARAVATAPTAPTRRTVLSIFGSFIWDPPILVVYWLSVANFLQIDAGRAPASLCM